MVSFRILTAKNWIEKVTSYLFSQMLRIGINDKIIFNILEIRVSVCPVCWRVFPYMYLIGPVIAKATPTLY